MWLKEQISSYINEKKIYGNQGDEVKLICEYGNVSIVELNGERFAVNIEKLSKTFVAKPAEVIQVKQKKKRRWQTLLANTTGTIQAVE